MDHDRDTPRPPPQEWADALAESRAQLAAGQNVSGADMKRELRESIARLEAKHGATSPA